MNKGIRLVIGTTALAAGILLQAESVFAQLPPWAQQDRRNYRPQQQQRQPQAQQQQQQQRPQQQQQPKAKPEPIQNVQERAA